MSVQDITPGQIGNPSCHVCGAIMTRAGKGPWLCVSCGATTAPSAIGEFITDQIHRGPVSQADGFAGEHAKSCVAVVFSCRVCAAPKKETNHWYIVSIADRFATKKILVSEWNVAMADLIAHGDRDFTPVCGEGCTYKILSRWFTTRSFEKPSVRSESSNNDEDTIIPDTVSVPDPLNLHNQEK
jgi:hypothetical protein